MFLLALAGTWRRALAFFSLILLVAMLHLFPALWPRYLPRMWVGPQQQLQWAAVIFLGGTVLVRAGFMLTLAAVITQPTRRTLAMYAFMAGCLLWTFESLRDAHVFNWLID